MFIPLHLAKLLYYRFRARRPFGDSRSLNESQKKYLRAVQVDGVTVMENYCTPQECQLLMAELDRLLRDYEPAIVRDECNSDSRAYGADQVSDPIHKYYADPFITGIGRAYMGADLQNFFTMANKVVPVPGNVGSGGGWHRDTVHERQFKSILYLTDVTEETGAFTYLPGSHRLSDLFKTIAFAGIRYAQYQYTDAEIDRIVQKSGVEPKTISGKAGSLILVDSSGIHRGRPILTGVRYAMANYFYDPDTIRRMRERKKFTTYFLGDSTARFDPELKPSMM